MVAPLYLNLELINYKIINYNSFFVVIERYNKLFSRKEA